MPGGATHVRNEGLPAGAAGTVEAGLPSAKVPTGGDRPRRHKMGHAATQLDEYALTADEPRSGAETSAGPPGNGSSGNNASDASAPSVDSFEKGTDESSSTSSSRRDRRPNAAEPRRARSSMTSHSTGKSRSSQHESSREPTTSRDPSSQDGNTNEHSVSGSSEAAWSSQNEVDVVYHAGDDIFEDVLSEQPPWACAAGVTPATQQLVTVVVKNINHKVVISEILALIEGFGFDIAEDCVRVAHVPCNRHQTRARGYALLQCASEAVADRLTLALHGFKKHGQRSLKVERQTVDGANALFLFGKPSFSYAYGPVSWETYGQLRAHLTLPPV